jgi:photosystem II stability/assembly factor-like uncharacterized protein
LFDNDDGSPQMNVTRWVPIVLLAIAGASSSAQFNWDSTKIGQGINMWGLVMTSRSTGMAAGDSGIIVRTTNGGAAWVRLNSGTTAPLSAIAMNDSLNGCAGGSNVLRYTTDAGNTWSAASIHVPVSIETISFDRYGNGVLTGQGGVIYRSTDSGKNWTVANPITTNHLLKACFVDSAKAIAVGGALTIVRSTDAGLNWSLAQTGTGTLRDVSSPSPGCAVAGGFSGSRGILQRSTNGGQSWDSVIVNGVSSFVLASFYSADTGYVFNSRGVKYRTVSGGKSWDTVGVGPISYSPFGVSITSANTGVLLGSSGMIYYAVSPLTGIGSAVRDAQSFVLSQNYPNPFNPSTTIQYTLPVKEHVALSVFNTLGERIAVLVDEDEQQGRHDVKFDGSNLATGVYFYRLQAGTSASTKKLLLLR